MTTIRSLLAGYREGFTYTASPLLFSASSKQAVAVAHGRLWLPSARPVTITTVQAEVVTPVTVTAQALSMP